MARPPLLARVRSAWRMLRADSSSTRPPWDDYWYTEAGAAAYRASSAGMTVSERSALTISSVYRAVRLLSDDVAQLPLHLYMPLPDRPDGLPGGKKRLRTDLAYVLGKRPNARQTSYEWRQMMNAHLLLRGNAYSRIVPGPRGAVSALEPLDPVRVRPELLDNGRVLYLVRRRDGKEDKLVQEEVFHLRGMQDDPFDPCGMSVVSVARRALGLTMATEEFGARQFSQTPRPSFLLKHPLKLDEAGAKRIQESFRAAWSGPEGWGGVPVIEEGMEAEKVGMSHDDAQFLETRQFQVSEVARWFGVPPHMIGDLTHATFSNIEQQSIDYLTHSLMPWLSLWEQAIERDLILDESFPQFVVDGLLRADSVARAQTEQLYVNMRATTPNEVRARNNWNPVPWGDEPAMPQGAAAPTPAAPREGNAPNPRDPNAADPTNRLAALNGSKRHE